MLELIRFIFIVHVGIQPVLAAPLVCEDEKKAQTGQTEAENINQRYDDFFRQQKANKERLARIQAGDQEVREMRQDRIRKLERARQEFVRIPRRRTDLEKYLPEWEEAQKERARQNELARRCEVDRRSKQRQQISKGRQVPPLEEFGLEDTY